MTSPTIAVIGAGWAGLSCALELTAAGQPVTLIEAGRHAGGRARGVELDGRRLDNGQHLLLGAYSATLRQLERIGSTHHLQRRPLTLSAPAAGFTLQIPALPLPAPLHLAWALLRAKGLSWRDKLSAARFMEQLKSHAWRVPPGDTVTRLLDRHGQPPRLRQLLWQPLCLAALNTPPEQACAQVFANVLRDSLGGPRQATELWLPDCDLGELFATPAVNWLTDHGSRWRPGQRVKTLEATAHGWAVDGEPFAQIMLAVAPQHAAALLPQDESALAPLREQLGQFRYQPIATLYLHFPASHGTAPRLPQPLQLLPGPDESAPWEFWLFDRGQCDGQPGVFSAVISAHGPWEALDDEALSTAIQAQICRHLLPELPAPHWQRLIRERRATFACTPQLSRPGHATALPGLWLAGDYTAGDYPATLEGAVRSGMAAAGQLLHRSGAKTS